MRTMTYPDKPKPGDRVAVLSPAAGLPGLFPVPHDLGLRRLTGDFGLVPVEYPTTRRLGSSPADRAADLHAAFADPDITAVITSIGGDDQITVLSHVDDELLRANPKPFFGYSDNVNLLTRLWELGIVAYHGGSIMTQFGRASRIHPLTEESLRAALFTRGTYRLSAPDSYGDEDVPWDSGAMSVEPPMFPSTGWEWHNADRIVEGPSWGGCLEVIAGLLMADKVLPVEEYAGCVLFLETSEEMPSAGDVHRILRGMGERGLLGQFAAVLFGRPKAWSIDRRTTPTEKAEYLAAQRESVRRAFAEYAPDAVLVLDVDLGHTDPQLVLPYGGTVRVDGPARTITVEY
ncbi:muramoyltetrapeptide carboxypeptidase LdcA involved in peptidoglycan recycling [Herbihabitans rhizosphaerae]|uniref:Muramoyltetrapeptide carboxypeptidase LdcA involved in peptidoglycan recycling n=1 Tax=Herbihabitans rhizosphaerae TaxID=1872711 RepID=A0A4Q7KL76_9PSEU|nr:S66 peptidase family protein [Herbihabitans rhizosphaerae]RZS34686.1 muramoyltetrapeptide carboxypeptidase LdcA involved in peptidoglycan recycling [Herbihabitans rhizosphaerae]